MQVTGNLKFDVRLPRRLRLWQASASAGGRSAGPVLVCGSTVEEEEAAAAAGFENLRARIRAR